MFYFWDGSAYRQVPTGEIRAQLSQSLACEFDRLYNHEQVRWARERDETPSPAGARRLPRPIAVTSRMMADVLQAIAGLVLIPAADCPDQPAWVQGFPDTSVPAAASLGAGACKASGAGTNGLQDPLATASWPVDEILPTHNALVHLPSFIDGGSCTVPPTPRFFNASRSITISSRRPRNRPSGSSSSDRSGRTTMRALHACKNDSVACSRPTRGSRRLR